MKKLFAHFLALVLIFSCTACNSDHKLIEEEIVPEETKDKAEDGKSAEENEDELAQEAYDCIENAELLCKSGIGSISAAWRFGIWDAPECSIDTVMEKLSIQIGFDVSYIEENGGYSAAQLVNGDEDFPGWEFCLWTTENCLAAIDAYQTVDTSLSAAKKLLKKVSEDYANYQNLKDYYTKVAVYAAYFKNITGSYNDLEDAIIQYEGDIGTAKEKLLFDFG